MIFDQSNQKESQTIEALVPMVDLFAVLAIVFMIYAMIYASDEVLITELTTANKIQQVEQESEQRIKDIVDQYENEPQIVLAQEAEKTLQEVKEKRRKKAEELVLAFSAMLEAQQDQSADEYEELVAAIEQKHKEALSQEKVTLDKQKQAEIEAEKQQLMANKLSKKCGRKLSGKYLKRK
jgi:biopolymer transport protein ExbD